MPLALRRAGCALISAAVVLVLAAPASAAPEAVGAAVKVSAGANGAQRLTYKIGPFDIIPGQNEIGNEIIAQKPQVDGWITRIRPDLIYTSGKVPGVDVIHLHHGVWLNLGESDSTWPGLPERFVAAGEEKTIVRVPQGLRLRPPRGGQVAPQPHDPQPHAGADEGLHGLRDRLHPRVVAEGARHQAGPADLDGRAEPAARTRCSTWRRAAGRRGSTPIRATSRRPMAPARAATNGWPTATASWSRRRVTSIRAASTPTSICAATVRGCARRAARARAPPRRASAASATRRGGAAATPIWPGRRPSTSSPRGPCPGTSP